mmetsp:Transcript_46729/g.74803  ORF Transcript_46729/g.74803 Transcript_46729/m.74803 type:complete len:443 (-) Transcript_46729:76-1404(-)
MRATNMNNNVLESLSKIFNRTNSKPSTQLTTSSQSQENSEHKQHLSESCKPDTNESKSADTEPETHIVFDDDTFANEYYFSYGSNMLPTHLRKCKDIHPHSVKRGVIPGWRLSFSCAILSNRSDPCFANIVPHRIASTPSSTNTTVINATVSPSCEDVDDETEETEQEQTYSLCCMQQTQHHGQAAPLTVAVDEVEEERDDPFVNGSIIEVDRDEFDKLDGYEFTYVRKQVEAYLYDEDGGGTLTVWVYVMDKKHEEYLNTKYPEQRYKFVEMPPSKNYLQTLVEGAKAVGLHDEYIEYLQAQSFQPYLKLQPTQKTLSIIDSAAFTMHDVEHWTQGKYAEKRASSDIKGPLMVLKGIVFDLNQSPPYFQSVYGGNDITLKQAARWVHANHSNTQSVDELEAEQQEFINNVVQGALMGGSILGKCVGRLSEQDKYGYHYYKW